MHPIATEKVSIASMIANMPSSCHAPILHGSMKITPIAHDKRNGARKPGPLLEKMLAPTIQQAVITAASGSAMRPEKSIRKK